MHPALWKGPLVYKTPPFSTFSKTPTVFHFLQKHPPHFPLFHKTPPIFHFLQKNTRPQFHFIPTGLLFYVYLVYVCVSVFLFCLAAFIAK